MFFKKISNQGWIYLTINTVKIVITIYNNFFLFHCIHSYVYLWCLAVNSYVEKKILKKWHKDLIHLFIYYGIWWLELLDLQLNNE